MGTIKSRMAVGRKVRDAYQGTVRTGEVVEDLDTHWRVDWGPNRTRIRKDRVGSSPKRQGPWWEGSQSEPTSKEREYAARASLLVDLDTAREHLERILPIADSAPGKTNTGQDAIEAARRFLKKNRD